MNFIQKETCCFTGHRIIPSYLLEDLRRALSYEVKRLYAIGVRNFISGGAIGFDTLAAEAVIKEKASRPDIRLILALPCLNQSAKWNKEQIKQYEVIKRHADEIVILSNNYYNGCMQARNRYMVENSSHCVSYCTKRMGGTFYTVCYAKKLGIELSELSGCVMPK